MENWSQVCVVEHGFDPPPANPLYWGCCQTPEAQELPTQFPFPPNVAQGFERGAPCQSQEHALGYGVSWDGGGGLSISPIDADLPGINK